MTAVIIRAALIADAISDAPKLDHAISVLDGRIENVGPFQKIRAHCSPETEIQDLGNVCVTPGLIDGHTHLSLAGDGRSYAEMFSETDEMMVLAGAMNLRKHLYAGITTVREHGARNKVGFALKEGVERGYIAGPRLFVSGRPITCTGGHFHFCNEVADGPDEVRRSVRRLVHEGADYIKIMASGGGTEGTVSGRASYSTEELRAAVHEAHHFHKLTAAHCRAKESMVRAVEAGIDLMEHAEFLDPDDRQRFDPEIAQMLAESGIWISPTLQALTSYQQIFKLSAKRDDDTLTRCEAQLLGKLETNAEASLDIVRRMLDYGLRDRLVPGTDSGPGDLSFGHLDYDLQLLHRVGLTPAELLASATRISAQASGIDDELGTIERGKIADLTVFDGDPTKDVKAFSKVVAVFQSGVQVYDARTSLEGRQ
jgi:imidazolonepropionase-like amidohydrolase